MLFPFAFLPFNIGRPRSITLLNDVMAGDRTIAVVTQKDGTVEEPAPVPELEFAVTLVRRFQRGLAINANEAVAARVPCRRTVEAGFSQRDGGHRACGKTFSGNRQIEQREIGAHRAVLFSVAAKKLG